MFDITKGTAIMLDGFIFDGMESNEYGIACVYFDLAVSMTYEVLKTDLSLEKAAMNNTFFLTSQAYSEPLK